MATIAFLVAFTFVSAVIILQSSYERSSQGIKIRIPGDVVRK